MQKGSLKPWQIGLFVVAIGAVAFALYNIISNAGPPIADHLTYVDVQTGDLFYYKIKKGAIIPAKNPDTGNMSLLPVKLENKVYKIPTRYLDALDVIPVAPDAIVNQSSGEVKVSSKSIRTITEPAGGKYKGAAPGADQTPAEPNEPVNGGN